MIAFERYAKFDVASLEAVQIRETIIEDINQSTPAAMFEGSLEDWQDSLKYGFEMEDDKEIQLTTDINDETQNNDTRRVTHQKSSDAIGAMPAHLSQKEEQFYQE